MVKSNNALLRSRLENGKFSSALKHLEGESADVVSIVNSLAAMFGNSGMVDGGLADLLAMTVTKLLGNVDVDHSTFPKRTLNGSSFQQMSVDVDAVVASLRESKERLANACPHPRDYPVAADEYMYKTAREQYDEHQRTLDELIAFYEDKRNHCLDQVK